MTWEYSYQAFATYLSLQKYPELSTCCTYKSPNNNGVESIAKEYEKLVLGAKGLGIDINEYTDIVDKGYTHISNSYAWECAGYDWDVKK